MRRVCALLLAALLLACAGCTPVGVDGDSPEKDFSVEERAIELALDAQLGLLRDKITDSEREMARTLLAKLWPLRQERLASERYEKSAEEQRLLGQLNQVYERCTARYIEDGGTWGYDSVTPRTLAGYTIRGGETLRPDQGEYPPDRGGWSEEDFQDLWEQMRAMLPEGAYENFGRFTIFTDGTYNTLAYVSAMDSRGDKWEIAVDPADAEDGELFTETVLHEYCHHITLNSGQVEYTSRQTTSTYNEDGMVSLPGSYLDEFYQSFWTDYLDDRLANMDSYNFFLRHEDDFVSDYASTDPSEDIAESFTYFVLYDRQPGDAVWEAKINFFYDYPELVEFREQTRRCLEK